MGQACTQESKRHLDVEWIMAEGGPEGLAGFRRVAGGQVIFSQISVIPRPILV